MVSLGVGPLARALGAEKLPGSAEHQRVAVAVACEPEYRRRGRLILWTALNQVQKLDPRKPPTIFLSDQGAEEGFEVLMAAGNQGPDVI
jgi:hypothetical protein